jgi:hypothetical protein
MHASIHISTRLSRIANLSSVSRPRYTKTKPLSLPSLRSVLDPEFWVHDDSVCDCLGLFDLSPWLAIRFSFLFERVSDR